MGFIAQFSSSVTWGPDTTFLISLSCKGLCLFEFSLLKNVLISAMSNVCDTCAFSLCAGGLQVFGSSINPLSLFFFFFNEWPMCCIWELCSSISKLLFCFETHIFSLLLCSADPWRLYTAYNHYLSDNISSPAPSVSHFRCCRPALSSSPCHVLCWSA